MPKKWVPIEPSPFFVNYFENAIPNTRGTRVHRTPICKAMPAPTAEFFLTVPVLLEKVLKVSIEMIIHNGVKFKCAFGEVKCSPSIRFKNLVNKLLYYFNLRISHTQLILLFCVSISSSIYVYFDKKSEIRELNMIDVDELINVVFCATASWQNI